MGKEIKEEKTVYICLVCNTEIDTSNGFCAYDCVNDCDLIEKRSKDKVKEVKLGIVTTTISERLLSEDGS